MNFETYFLTLKSQKYNRCTSGKIAKCAKLTVVQMKFSIFKPSEFIFILTFLNNFKKSFESSGTHEEAAMWLFFHLMKSLVNIGLAHRLGAIKENNLYKERSLTAYCQAVNYLLETYATDDVIAEEEADLMKYNQLIHMSTVCYSETLWKKRCDMNESTMNQDSTGIHG